MPLAPPRRPSPRDIMRAIGFPPETFEPERSPVPPDGPQFDVAAAAVELLRGPDDADVMARRRGGA